MRAIRIPYKTAQEIRALLARAAPEMIDGYGKYPRAIAEIDAALKPKKSARLAKARKAQDNERRHTEWAAIRHAALRRANNFCERCGSKGADFNPLDADHMFGRGGGRKSLESIYTVWALRRNCHQAKTNNQPNAAWWLHEFVAHCDRADAGDTGFDVAAGIAQARIDSLRISGFLPHGRKTK